MINPNRCIHVFDKCDRRCRFCGMPEKYLHYTHEQKEELAVEHLISTLRDLGDTNGLGNTS